MMQLYSLFRIRLGALQCQWLYFENFLNSFVRLRGDFIKEHLVIALNFRPYLLWGRKASPPPTTNRSQSLLGISVKLITLFCYLQPNRGSIATKPFGCATLRASFRGGF
jgi:hypothetical protein